MLTRLKRGLSPSMVVSLMALFVSLGGAGYAATGGNFILGNPNSATSETSLSGNAATNSLRISNPNTTAGATALSLNVPPVILR